MSDEGNRYLEELGASIIQNMTEGVVIENAAGYFTFVNPATAALLGYALEDLLGKHWTTIVPPDQQPIVRAADERRAHGQADRYELEIVRKDSTRITVLIAGSPRFENGHWAGSLAVFTDITERKRAEQQLQWRTEDLALINTINEAINSGVGLSQVNRLMSQETQRFFSSNGTHLYLLDPNKQWLTLLDLGLPPKVVQQIESLVGMPIPPIRLPVQALTLYRQVLEQKQSICSNDPKIIQSLIAEFATGVPLPEPTRTLLSRLVGTIYSTLGIRGVIVVPLLAQDEPIGLLDMSRTKPFSEDDLKRVETIAAQLTVAIARQRAEQALRSSEELYRHAAEATGQLIYDFDTTTRQIHWAGTLEAITGYAPHEFPATDIGIWEEMLHPDDRAYALEQLRQANQEGRAYHVEYRFRRKDGTYTFIEDWGIFLKNAAGQLYRMIGAMKDITERKRAEQALRESEDRYRDLVEASPVIIVLHDLQGRVISVNLAASKLLGYSVDELTHLNVRDGLTPDTRTRFEAYSAAVQQNGQASGLMRVQTRRGETRLLEYTSTLRTEGVAAPIVRAMARDVTELKRAEHAQARLTQQLAALYETFLEINAQTDLDQLLPMIVSRAADLLEGRMGALYLVQPDQETLKLVVSHNLPGDWVGTTLRLGEGLSGQVAQTGEPLMVEDHSQWDQQASVYKDTPFRRVLGVPLQVGKRVVGVLNITDTERTGLYDANEVRLASLFADQAAIAIENARLFAETKRRANESAALYEVTQDLTTQTDVNTLLQTVIARATALLNSSSGAIFLYDAARGEVELAVTKDSPLASHLRLKLGEGMAGRVAQTRQPLVVDDYSVWEHQIPATEGIPFRASLDVPMIFGGELIGVLDVSEIGDSTRRYTEDDARLLSLFATQAASAVANARLLQQTQQRAQQLALLYDAVLTLNRAIEPHQVIEHLLEIANTSVHSDRADFYRYHPESRTLNFESGGGYAEQLIPTLRTLTFSSGEARGLVGLVAAERTPLYLPDTLADSRWIPIDPAIRSAFWVPVEREKQLFGVLVVTSTRMDAFTPADQRVVALFANQVAVALERAHLFAAEQTRRAELAALYDLSRALADNDTLDAICDLVVQHAVATLPLTFARLALIEGDALVVHATQPSHVLNYDLKIGDRVALTNLPHCQHALEQNQPTLQDTLTSPISADERAFVLFDLAKTVCFVPLRGGGHPLGLLILGEIREPERRPFTTETLHHVRSIGDQAASALRRAKLREQTEHRLRQVQTLHTIDMTITASLNLNVTLNVLLTQVITQLGADAAAVLLFNPHTQMLEYLAGHGFRTKAIEQSSLRLGKEYAGHAALERRIVSEFDLPTQRATLSRSFLCTDEEFVSCVCAPLIAKGQIKGVLETYFRTSFQPDPDWLAMLEALGAQAAIAMDNAELFNDLQRSILELTLAHDATITSWARAIQLRTQESPERVDRVTELTLRLARAYGIHESELRHIRHGALLHDVGMLNIPDAILHKRDVLTTEEADMLRDHPRQAYTLLTANAYLRPALDIPYCHHENWDGSGYPRGLAGEQIPLAARLFATADAWDTLTVGQSAQPAQAQARARAHFQTLAGQMLDPRAVDTLLQLTDADSQAIVV